MRKISIRLFSIICVSVLLVAIPRQRAAAQEVTASYQDFYDELAPYGQWVSDQQYGDVWVPNAEAGFRPYATNGHWAMTDYGNMWVSNDPYGWATYHYGRWTYNSYYGWVWIPGQEWAPAWVSWRSGNGYYGWAPMGPGYEAGGSYAYPDDYWVFVGPEYLYSPNVYSYYDASRNYYYCQHTAYSHDMYEGGGMRYNYGPRREVIEREVHQPVQVYHISNAGYASGARVSGNTVSIYRPSINAATMRTSRPSNLIRGSQPIGKPQEMGHGQANAQPAFHQEVQNHNAQINNQTRAANVAQPGRQNQFQNANTQQPNRPQQPQHFQQQNNQQAEQPRQPTITSREDFNQRVHSQEAGNTPAPQHSQPANNQQRFSQQQGNNQQQRSQPQQQQQQQQRSQPQPQQRSQPQPQQQRQQPAQQSQSREGGNRR